jgi:hypothetical protein
MWSYYGAKTNLVGLYPKPKHDLIIEPFAGSARYSLRYFDREIILIDKYISLVNIWKWLQKCSTHDILSLPDLKRTDLISDQKLDCKEAEDLLGFIIGCGAERPRNMPTSRKTTQRPKHVRSSLERIAKNLFKIKNWTIIQGDYSISPEIEATWFIDPPYQFGGAAYVESSRNIDFKKLSTWCKNRLGQVIVCENTKADWMVFNAIKDQRGSVYTTTEAMWSNEKLNYSGTQLKLI